ncbi:MAG: hypothetical protein AAGA55_00875 [Planctomycetota bacterium]
MTSSPSNHKAEDEAPDAEFGNAAAPPRGELRAHTIRIVSNYARLASTLMIGILIVPLMFRWLGDVAFGLVAMLGTNIGLAAIFRQIMQKSLVRELGGAYHAGDRQFKRSFAALYRIGLILAGISVFTFGLLILLLPLFTIPPDLLSATRWFVAAQGIQSVLLVFLSPTLNCFLVIERFIAYSVWFVSLRLAQPIAIVLLGYVLHIDDPASGLLWLGIVWSGLAILVYAVGVGVLVARDRRLAPTLRTPEPGAVREVMGTFSWNSGVQVAMNFHEMLPPILLNLVLGPLANAAWGVGFRLVAYIRMATTGMQFGSDAVSARLAKEDNADARRQLQHLIGIQTRMTSVIAVPAGIGVFLFSFPILHLWVGAQVERYADVIPDAVLIVRVLTLALAARAVSDTWILVLYGAGMVRSYAPMVIAGGLAAPVIGLALIHTLPEDLAVVGPAIAFTAAFAGLHLCVIPFIAGRQLHISPLALLSAVWRPALATTIAAGVTLAFMLSLGTLGSLGIGRPITESLGRTVDPIATLAAAGVFAACTAAAMYAIALRPEDRQRLARLAAPIRRRIPGLS